MKSKIGPIPPSHFENDLNFKIADVNRRYAPGFRGPIIGRIEQIKEQIKRGEKPLIPINGPGNISQNSTPEEPRNTGLGPRGLEVLRRFLMTNGEDLIDRIVRDHPKLSRSQARKDLEAAGYF
jgi:hypothetical protein